MTLAVWSYKNKRLELCNEVVGAAVHVLLSAVEQQQAAEPIPRRRRSAARPLRRLSASALALLERYICRVDMLTLCLCLIWTVKKCFTSCLCLKCLLSYANVVPLTLTFAKLRFTLCL
ncbi:hypothetical protein ACJJTC_014270 [Scirpophaga incertulas]